MNLKQTIFLSAAAVCAAATVSAQPVPAPFGAEAGATFNPFTVTNSAQFGAVQSPTGTVLPTINVAPAAASGAASFGQFGGQANFGAANLGAVNLGAANIAAPTFQAGSIAAPTFQAGAVNYGTNFQATGPVQYQWAAPQQQQQAWQYRYQTQQQPQIIGYRYAQQPAQVNYTVGQQRALIGQRRIITTYGGGNGNYAGGQVNVVGYDQCAQQCAKACSKNHSYYKHCYRSCSDLSNYYKNTSGNTSFDQSVAPNFGQLYQQAFLQPQLQAGVINAPSTPIPANWWFNNPQSAQWFAAPTPGAQASSVSTAPATGQIQLPAAAIAPVSTPAPAASGNPLLSGLGNFFSFQNTTGSN